MTSKTDNLGRKTVLIVEDQALLRRTMRELLQEAFPHHDFVEAADGVSTLRACSAYRPDLVLMDKCLPDADGIELTAQLKKLYPQLQVIVISYRSAEVYVQRALAAGARAFVVKDRLSSELIPAVAAAIGVPDILREPDK